MKGTSAMPIKPAIDVKLMVYDEMEIGQELPPLQLQHDDDWQGRILVALDDENPWYWKESPWGEPILNPALLDDAPMVSANRAFEYPFGFVHARQETEFYKPLSLGKPVNVVTKVVDKYRKRDKGYIVIESLVTEEDGTKIMATRNHAMIDDERIRDAMASGLKHHPPHSAEKYMKKD